MGGISIKITFANPAALVRVVTGSLIGELHVENCGGSGENLK